MLYIKIPATELYNDELNEFFQLKEKTLQLEHSLVSLSKWESKYEKPFLVKGNKTRQETIDYIRCMTITQNVDSIVYQCITKELITEVENYINLPMTATTFSKDPSNSINREIITAEVIYYWMIALNIPFECQKWHLNKLLTLIKVCNIKNKPAKSMSRSQILAKNRALNAKRRAAMHTRG